MIERIKVGQIRFPEIRIRPEHLHKVRGYFADQFRQFDLLHNHQEGADKYFYRYPAMQFKMVDGILTILAFSVRAIDILTRIFLESGDIDVEGRVLQVREREIEVKEEPFGEDGRLYNYHFISPWIALNQENYKQYLLLAGEKERRNKLEAIMINNIISFCKFAGYTVQGRLLVNGGFQPRQVNLKGKVHLAFLGEFAVDFLLPDLLGLGKSSSRGYGSIVKV